MDDHENTVLAPASGTVSPAALQQQNAVAMQTLIADFARMLTALDEQNRKLQRIIESRVTVTTAQTRMLTHAIAGRAAAICEENRLPYTACGRRIRETISRELKTGFTVAAVGDIPAVSLTAALSFVQAWNSYRLVRELRRKNPAG